MFLQKLKLVKGLINFFYLKWTISTRFSYWNGKRIWKWTCNITMKPAQNSIVKCAVKILFLCLLDWVGFLWDWRCLIVKIRSRTSGSKMQKLISELWVEQLKVWFEALEFYTLPDRINMHNRRQFEMSQFFLSIWCNRCRQSLERFGL